MKNHTCCFALVLATLAALACAGCASNTKMSAGERAVSGETVVIENR